MVEREDKRGHDLMDGVASVLTNRQDAMLFVTLDGTTDGELVVQRLSDAAAEDATVHIGGSPSC